MEPSLSDLLLPDPFASRSQAGDKHANQDRVWSDAKAGWALVVDGGGPDGQGEQAADMVIRTISERLANRDQVDDADIKATVDAANTAVVQAQFDKTTHVTMLLARFSAGQVRLWQIGDVRAYLYRDGELQPLTQDHCLASLLVARGQLTRDQARSHQASRTLLRYLGKPGVEAEVSQVTLNVGDRVMLCTNGVHAELTDAVLTGALAAANPTEALAALCAEPSADDRSAMIYEETGSGARFGLPDGVLDSLFTIITQTSDPEQILQQILELAVSTSKGERGFIFLVDEEGNLDCRVRCGSPAPYNSEAISRSTIQRTVSSGKPLVVSDILDNQQFSNQQSVQALSLEAVLCVPLKTPQVSGEAVIGVIYIDRTSPMAAIDDLRLLELLGNYAGVIIQNSALFANTRLQNERLQVLNNLSRSISGSSDIDAIMHDILGNALRVSGADEAFVLMGSDLTYRYGLNKHMEVLPEMKRVSFSALRYVAQEMRSLCVLDASSDELLSQQASVAALDLRTVMCVPILLNGGLDGAIYVSGKAAISGFTKSDLTFLESLATHASVAFSNARLLKQQEQQIEQLEFVLELYKTAQQQAITDDLTGLLNRNYYEQHFARLVEGAQRYGYPLCLVMIDLDHFKRINDQFGHQGGDQVLRRVGRVLSDLCRNCDTVVRYGGEEFAVLLPHTPLAGAELVANQILTTLRDSHGQEPAGGIPVTASIGIAQLEGRHTPDAFLEKADKALYTAKAGGRNQVVIAPLEGYDETAASS